MTPASSKAPCLCKDGVRGKDCMDYHANYTVPKAPEWAVKEASHLFVYACHSKKMCGTDHVKLCALISKSLASAETRGWNAAIEAACKVRCESCSVGKQTDHTLNHPNKRASGGYSLCPSKDIRSLAKPEKTG